MLRRYVPSSSFIHCARPPPRVYRSQLTGCIDLAGASWRWLLHFVDVRSMFTLAAAGCGRVYRRWWRGVAWRGAHSADDGRLARPQCCGSAGAAGRLLWYSVAAGRLPCWSILWQ